MKTAKQLQWTDLEGHFGNSWVASIEGFSSCYAVWIDRETGKTIASDTNSNRSEHINVEEAKRWCQENFNQMVGTLVSTANNI